MVSELGLGADGYEGLRAGRRLKAAMLDLLKLMDVNDLDEEEFTEFMR